VSERRCQAGCRLPEWPSPNGKSLAGVAGSARRGTRPDMWNPTGSWRELDQPRLKLHKTDSGTFPRPRRRLCPPGRRAAKVTAARLPAATA
jgi:hypothetical protein